MNIWRPYTHLQSAQAALHIVAAEGAYLHTADGRKIFDAISSWWLITHGHAHPHIAAAIAQQAARVEQVVFANFVHDAALALVDKLQAILPQALQHVFLSDNGSTAVEVAMKMAYQYCARNGMPHKQKFIAFDKAYHGDTCGAMSASHRSDFNTPYAGMQFDVLYAKQGHDSTDDLDTWIADFKIMLEQHAHTLCAVLIEPLLQGAGGMIVWPIDAVQTICAIAKSYDVLVIFDEVMTGFGRTGSMFALDQIGCIPDFLCLSKGLTGGFLPMGLTLTHDFIYDAFVDKQPNAIFYHGHSFTGNAISCAAAVANLDIFAHTDFIKTAEEIKTSHAIALSRLQYTLPVRDTRVCGTVGILDLDINNTHYGSDFSKRFQQAVLQDNIFLRTLGSVIYIMPPYCATAVDIAWAWEIVEHHITKLLHDLP